MNFYRKLILMFCLIFDYSPKAMKLTKQINKKLTKTIGYKLLKHNILTTKILEYKTFIGFLRLELKPYSLICLCCQDLVKGEEECEVCGANGDL